MFKSRLLFESGLCATWVWKKCSFYSSAASNQVRLLDTTLRFRKYCNRRKFRTRFNFIYFVLLADSTKFSSIQKLCTYQCMWHHPRCTKIYSVRKFASARVRNFYAYENFCDYSIKLLGLKRIQILSNPSPKRVVEANTGYPRILLDT